MFGDISLFRALICYMPIVQMEYGIVLYGGLGEGIMATGRPHLPARSSSDTGEQPEQSWSRPCPGSAFPNLRPRECLQNTKLQRASGLKENSLLHASAPVPYQPTVKSPMV